MQVVGYEPDVGTGASLRLAEDGRLSRQALDPGTTLAFGLGDRRCAGRLTDEGHTPCQSSIAPRCGTHAETWVCARCTGTCLKPEMDCHETHAVYLAAFAPATFKVGVTRRARLETRLIEQGADRGALVRTVSNGRIARELEADIATRVGDRVRVEEKVRGLSRPVDEAAWERLLGSYEVQDRFAPSYDLALEAPPTPETMARGTVRGTKGRIMILDRDGGPYAVDMRDLVGYILDPSATPAARQVRLGAFD